MKLIQAGTKFAKVDDDMYEILSKYTWGQITRGYVISSRAGMRQGIFMHHLVMPPPPGLVIDHIDRDPLNNQRSNLRVVTASENQFNRPKQKNNTSGFKGVHKDRRVQKWPWVAMVRINKKCVRIGSYATAEEAARAYDKYVLAHVGNVAHLNFPAVDVTCPS